ncbi:MAG: pyrroline-5-carboxylate reductase, partial [Rhodospirillaceae bacterium]|nr:pyrroline-5-carboxylate reductase [Rhodospirillaceae bacterium]
MIEGAILLVGCGRMGGALLEGWFKSGISPVDVIIVEPAGRDSIAPCSKHRALTCLASVTDVPRDFVPDVVLFAVKPQVIDTVVGNYSRFVDKAPVFLSVVAGKTTGYFQKHLGEAAAVVRCMPNTPAAVGKAVTAMYAAPAASAVQRRVCEMLLQAVGEVAWLADEAHMDAVTAVSGSGPAYVFLMVEALRDAGVAAGVPADVAEHLARAAAIGSGALLERDAAAAPDVLRHN